MIVTGWGATEIARSSSIKQKLSVPIIEQEQCIAHFGVNGVPILDQHLCAGGEEGKDSCKGDSGGPLIAVAPDDGGLFYIEGIVSFGRKPCGGKNAPGVYTRVSKYLEWIYGNIEP